MQKTIYDCLAVKAAIMQLRVSLFKLYYTSKELSPLELIIIYLHRLEIARLQTILYNLKGEYNGKN